MILNSEYDYELRKTYTIDKTVPEMLASARTLLGQIEDADEFLPIRLDALTHIALELRGNAQKFGIRNFAVKDAHKCGVLCPEHGDPRDTNIVPAGLEEVAL